MAFKDRTGPHSSLLTRREEIFRELEEAEQEYSRVRLVVERMESDLRIGLAEPADYQEAKGRVLPRSEQRVVELFRELLKVEDAIKLKGPARQTDVEDR